MCKENVDVQTSAKPQIPGAWITPEGRRPRDLSTMCTSLAPLGAAHKQLKQGPRRSTSKSLPAAPCVECKQHTCGQLALLVQHVLTMSHPVWDTCNTTYPDLPSMADSAGKGGRLAARSVKSLLRTSPAALRKGKCVHMVRTDTLQAHKITRDKNRHLMSTAADKTAMLHSGNRDSIKHRLANTATKRNIFYRAALVGHASSISISSSASKIASMSPQLHCSCSTAAFKPPAK